MDGDKLGWLVGRLEGCTLGGHVGTVGLDDGVVVGEAVGSH